LIAEIARTPVGYTQLRRGAPPAIDSGQRPIEIVRIYADKAWLGQGVGAALMSACLTLARQKSCDTVWLDVWEKNPRAIAFYQKWGFAVVGSQPFQLGSDMQQDLIMLRPVD
jgi:ribosomal protein S18 acetylase RimI-like enzyme